MSPLNLVIRRELNSCSHSIILFIILFFWKKTWSNCSLYFLLLHNLLLIDRNAGFRDSNRLIKLTVIKPQVPQQHECFKSQTPWNSEQASDRSTIAQQVKLKKPQKLETQAGHYRHHEHREHWRKTEVIELIFTINIPVLTAIKHTSVNYNIHANPTSFSLIIQVILQSNHTELSDSNNALLKQNN